WREGHRRDGDDRVHRDGLQRGPRRGGTARRQDDRHAADTRARLAGHPRGPGELAMYPASFEYYRPRSVAEAVELLRTKKGAKVLAGGHSLLPAMKLRVSGPPALVDIGRLPELRGIQKDGGGVSIMSLTTHAEVAASAEVRQACPVLAEAAAQIGDLAVRNRGTIAAPPPHSAPAAALPPLMLRLGPPLTASDGKASRQTPAAQFFLDIFTTALKDGELLTKISVPGYGKGTGAVYLKHRHPASSYAV